VQLDEKGAKKTKRSRYWSVMLVGDHGRVIPFRHFKALTVGVGIALILCIGALILLGVMYAHQRQKIITLQENLMETRAQTAKFRDEKDLYLTQLIALQKQTGELAQNSPDEKESLKESAQLEVEAPDRQNPNKVEQEPDEQKNETPAPKEEPKVKWSADIRNFSVSFDNQQQILKAQFRIYNTSRPKKTLVGRTVVVFKASDDPPIQWAVVPEVPLRDGKPVGNKGKSFRVNNYRTETFKSWRRKNSAEYETASIYIFSEQGELIANQEMPFNVDYSPPEPVAPPSAPKREKASDAPEIQPNDRLEPAAEKPVGPTTPDGGDSHAEPGGPIPSPTAPSASPNPTPQPESNSNAPQDTLDDKGNPEPVNTESTSQTPAAEPKPALEGGTK